MTYNLTDIEYVANDDSLTLILFDFDKQISVEMSITYETLVSWFPDEFQMYKKVQRNNDEPQYIPTDSLYLLKLWCQEYMTKKRTWQLWEKGNIEKLIFNTIE